MKDTSIVKGMTSDRFEVLLEGLDTHAVDTYYDYLSLQRSGFNREGFTTRNNVINSLLSISNEDELADTLIMLAYLFPSKEQYNEFRHGRNGDSRRLTDEEMATAFCTTSELVKCEELRRKAFKEFKKTTGYQYKIVRR